MPISIEVFYEKVKKNDHGWVVFSFWLNGLQFLIQRVEIGGV